MFGIYFDKPASARGPKFFSRFWLVADDSPYRGSEIWTGHPHRARTFPTEAEALAAIALERIGKYAAEGAHVGVIPGGNGDAR